MCETLSVSVALVHHNYRSGTKDRRPLVVQTMRMPNSSGTSFITLCRGRVRSGKSRRRCARHTLVRSCTCRRTAPPMKSAHQISQADRAGKGNEQMPLHQCATRVLDRDRSCHRLHHHASKLHLLLHAALKRAMQLLDWQPTKSGSAIITSGTPPNDYTQPLINNLCRTRS